VPSAKQGSRVRFDLNGPAQVDGGDARGRALRVAGRFTVRVQMRGDAASY